MAVYNFHVKCNKDKYGRTANIDAEGIIEAKITNVNEAHETKNIIRARIVEDLAKQNFTAAPEDIIITSLTRLD